MTKQTHLYRHFDAEGNLLYVGISKSTMDRLAQHSEKDWYSSISNVTIEKFDERNDAIIAERKAIIAERPIWNKQRFTSPRVIQSQGMSSAELIAWRERMGITKGEAAKALGLSPNGYGAYERGYYGSCPRPIPRHVELACERLEQLAGVHP